MLGLSDVTRTSIVRSLTARELPPAVERYMVYCRMPKYNGSGATIFEEYQTKSEYGWVCMRVFSHAFSLVFDIPPVALLLIVRSEG